MATITVVRVPDPKENIGIIGVISKKELTRAGLSNKVIEFARTYRVEYKQRIGRREVTHVYDPFVYRPNHIYVPRFLIRAMANLGLTIVVPAPLYTAHGELEPLAFIAELWESKTALVNRLVDQIRETGGGVLKLNTGKGKTVIISKGIATLNPARTIVFAANKLLAEQLAGEIEACLGIEVGRIGGGHKYVDSTMWKEARIWVVIVNSALKIPAADFAQFEFAVFDECHIFCAPKTRLLMARAQCRWMLATSATVDKYWNWTTIVHACGAFIDGDEMVAGGVFEGTVRAIHYQGPPEYTQRLLNASGMMCVAYMADQFAEDPYRRKMIANILFDLLARGHSVMVLASTNKPIIEMHDLCRQFRPQDWLAWLPGILNANTKEAEKERIYRESRLIFTNYSSSSLGVNIPRLTAMVFISSFVDNGIQISGRALRREDGVTREYVDIVDAPMSRQWPTRRDMWIERGFTIREEKVSYASILDFAPSKN